MPPKKGFTASLLYKERRAKCAEDKKDWHAYYKKNINEFKEQQKEEKRNVLNNLKAQQKLDMDNLKSQIKGHKRTIDKNCSGKGLRSAGFSKNNGDLLL